MRRYARIVWSAPLLMLLAAISGCGDDYGNRQEISGAVTLKGQPLDEGTISFMPTGESSQAELVTKSGALITNGKYEIPRPQGLVPGKYKVSISSGDGVTPAEGDELPGPNRNIVSKDRIPAEYNANTRQQVEVKDPGPNVFDFPIP